MLVYYEERNNQCYVCIINLLLGWILLLKPDNSFSVLGVLNLCHVNSKIKFKLGINWTMTSAHTCVMRVRNPFLNDRYTYIQYVFLVHLQLCQRSSSPV